MSGVNEGFVLRATWKWIARSCWPTVTAWPTQTSVMAGGPGVLKFGSEKPYRPRLRGKMSKESE